MRYKSSILILFLKQLYVIIIIIIIYIALNSRTGSVQKRSEEKNPSGFEFGVFHPPGSCLTRLMRPPPQKSNHLILRNYMAQCLQKNLVTLPLKYNYCHFYTSHHSSGHNTNKFFQVCAETSSHRQESDSTG